MLFKSSRNVVSEFAINQVEADCHKLGVENLDFQLSVDVKLVYFILPVRPELLFLLVSHVLI